jgi:hypothetical protein
MKVYRITARDKDGRMTEAASVNLEVEGPDEIVKVERIHTSTGEVLRILQRVSDTRSSCSD